MRILKSIISLLLIFVMMMSITNSVVHFHYCHNTGDHFFDFHYPGLIFLTHGDYQCRMQIHGSSLDEPDQRCEDEPLCCNDIRSVSKTDKIYDIGKTLIKNIFPEYLQLNIELRNIFFPDDYSDKISQYIGFDTSPPEIITTRILLL